MFNQLTQNKQLLAPLGIGILLVLILIVFAIFLLPGSVPQQSTISPTPTPYPSLSGSVKNNRYAKNQKTTITETTRVEIEKRTDVEQKIALSEGRIKYSLTSPLVTRKNEIITQNGKVIFERILIPEKRSDPGYVTISEYKALFGKPEEEIQGSQYYGELYHALIYASKGFTLIGNTNTDEVFEVQVYEPMTVEGYIQTFGEDIEESTGAVQ